MGGVGNRAQGEVLLSHVRRPGSSEARNRKLDAVDGSRGTDSRRGGGRTAMSWLQRLFTTRRMDRELDAELRNHIDLMVAQKIRSGMTEEEARRETRLEFGGLEQVKEDC